MKQFSIISLLISALAVIVLLAGIIMQNECIYKPSALVLSVSFAIGLGAIESLRGFRYTAWIIAAVVAGMLYPGAFTHWGSFDLRNKWLMLVIIQLVMFGMGIQMKLKDFSGLMQTGKGVAIGLFCHFSIMPLMGLLLTKIFNFEPEIAAGVILIGSCSSGLASASVLNRGICCHRSGLRARACFASNTSRFGNSFKRERGARRCA